MSAELLAIEVGKSAQPLLNDYSKYNKWATDCTLKALWEKLDRFGFKMSLNTIDMHPPREGDRWIMTAFEEAGYSGKEAEILNLVRLDQEVVYESDVFQPDGKTLDERYLTKRSAEENAGSPTSLAGRKFHLDTSAFGNKPSTNLLHGADGERDSVTSSPMDISSGSDDSTQQMTCPL